MSLKKHRLAVGQHPADRFHIRVCNNLGLAKTSLPLSGLFGQNMAGMGFAEFVFT
jgi:hypothetical protein